MYRAISVVVVLTATCAIVGPANAVPFTPGNLVVSMIHQGTPGMGVSMDDSAGLVSLVEFGLTPGSSAVQTIDLPTVASGNQRALTISTAGFREGHLSRSADGRYLVIGGYDAPVGTAKVAETFASMTNRVIGRIAADGSADTSTAMTDAYGGGAGAAFRSVATTDGTGFWTTGNAVSASGDGVTRYMAFGTVGLSQRLHSTSSTKNTRVANIFGDQLYHSSNSGSTSLKGVVKVGTGTPTTGTSNSMAVVPGFTYAPGSDSSPYDFQMFDLDPNVAGLDTLYLTDDGYIADDGLGGVKGGGLAKYTFNGTTWAYQYIMRTGLEMNVQALRSLTGIVGPDGNVVFYGITGKDPGGNQLVTLTDLGAGSAFSVLQTAPAGTIFRGVDFAAIPEPTTIALLGLGSLFCLRRRCRA